MKLSSAYTFEPIGHLKSCFETRNGTPRQAGLAPASRATLTLTSSQLNNPSFSLDGLNQFSYVWLLFVFHLDDHANASLGKAPAPRTTKSKIAPPRLGGRKLGLFATRSPHRPVPIGLSLVKLTDISDATLTFEGVDLVNETPILDVKPFIPTWDDPHQLHRDFRAHQKPIELPTWAQAPSIYENNLTIRLTQRAANQLDSIFKQNPPKASLLTTPSRFLEVLWQLLAAEPRSRYRRDKCSDRLYFVQLDGLHITAWFDDDNGTELAEVLRITDQDPRESP